MNVCHHKRSVIVLRKLILETADTVAMGYSSDIECRGEKIIGHRVLQENEDKMRDVINKTSE